MEVVRGALGLLSKQVVLRNDTSEEAVLHLHIEALLRCMDFVISRGGMSRSVL